MSILQFLVLIAFIIGALGFAMRIPAGETVIGGALRLIAAILVIFCAALAALIYIP